MGVLEYLRYDPTSPSCLRWAVDRLSWGGRKKQVCTGDVAGSISVPEGTGYSRWTVSVDNKTYLVHRLIWEMFNGPIPDDMVIDHINGNPLDNTLANLRAVVREVNARNKRKYSTNKSGVTGVCKMNNGSGGIYYMAQGRCPSSGKNVSKYFSVSKLGDDVAFALACRWRQDLIQSFNANGACYTRQHGGETTMH